MKIAGTSDWQHEYHQVLSEYKIRQRPDLVDAARRIGEDCLEQRVELATLVTGHCQSLAEISSCGSAADMHLFLPVLCGLIRAYDLPARLAERQAEMDGLTRREREIVEFVVEGLSNRAIADKLGISPRTVEVHRKNAMRKLNVTNVVQLVRKLAIVGFSCRPKPAPSIHDNGEQ